MQDFINSAALLNVAGFFYVQFTDEVDVEIEGLRLSLINA